MDGLEEEKNSSAGGRLHVLVIYDIIDDRKRLKLAKMLQGYGFRIQKSAFEALIDRKTYKKLLKCLPPYVSEEDSIRVYKFFGGNQVTSFGRAAEQDEDDIVVI